MATVSSLLFPRCRICHGDISLLPRPSENICATCAGANDVQAWREELRAAEEKLDEAEHGVACCGEHGGRRARRQAETHLKKARKHERRAAFRLISAQLTARVRSPDRATLSALEDARGASGFGRHHPEPGCRFAAYARSRFEDEALSDEALDDIERVLPSMTGHSALSEIPAVNTDALIGLANGDVLVARDPAPPLALLPSESLWICLDAELWEPTQVVQSQTAKGGLTAPLGPGARVGIEQAHTVTLERPGAFHKTADGKVAVTSRSVIFIGGRTVSIEHRDVVGIGADRDTCEIQDRTAPLPVRFRAPGGRGAVVAAYVNAARRRLN